MDRTDNMPIWVYFAFSSIPTRKAALWLIRICGLFTLYCFPYPLLLENTNEAVAKYLIEDWSWFGMMVPILLWYWLSLRWMDKQAAWPAAQA